MPTVAVVHVPPFSVIVPRSMLWTAVSERGFTTDTLTVVLCVIACAGEDTAAADAASRIINERWTVVMSRLGSFRERALWSVMVYFRSTMTGHIGGGGKKKGRRRTGDPLASAAPLGRCRDWL